MKINYKHVNPNKLYDELIAGGIFPSLVENDKKEGEHISFNTWITFPGGVDLEKVQSIVDIHDPSPVPPPLTEKERIAMLEDTVKYLLGI